MPEVLVQWQMLAEDFHFLRPWWFAILPLVGLMSWWRRRNFKQTSWRTYIRPDLLNAMLHQGQSSAVLTPTRLLYASLIVWLLALAGPSYSRQTSPLVDAQAPLVIALYLGASMMSEDLIPNRLTHAKLKIAELLKARQGAATALIAYSGSAHSVLPLTEDSAIVDLYLKDLAPELMPKAGNRMDLAARLAQQLLTDADFGSVLWITDNVPRIAFGQDELLWLKQLGSTQLLLIGDSTESRPRHHGELTVVPLRADNDDIEQLLTSIKTRYQASLTDNGQTHWRDDGYYLLWPLLILLLLWFRQGMVLQW